MSILISKNGKQAQKVDAVPFAKEDNLQQYIHDNPASIPLYDIKEDVDLLVLAREVSTPSGPLDEFAIDQIGELYITETKLYKNSDKRTVLAQVLDYGAALWKASTNFDDFIRYLDKEVQKKWNMTLQEKIEEHFQIDPQEILDRMRQNFEKGNFKFVILMDKLDDRLKDLILYINQNSRFDVFAVEMEYYKFEDYEITIPKLYGTEVKKSVDKGTSNRERWDEDRLLEEAKNVFTDAEYKAFEKIYTFSKDYADSINYGTGSYGTFSPIFNKLSGKSLFTLGTDGRLAFNFEWIAKDNEESAILLKEKLESIGFTFEKDYLERRPRVGKEEWSSTAANFIEVIKDII